MTHNIETIMTMPRDRMTKAERIARHSTYNKHELSIGELADMYDCDSSYVVQALQNAGVHAEHKRLRRCGDVSLCRDIRDACNRYMQSRGYVDNAQFVPTNQRQRARCIHG